MGTRGGTTAIRLAGSLLSLGTLVALGACTGTSSGRAEPTSSPVPSSVPVTVADPHARGPIPVRLQVGLAELTPDTCDRLDERRVCSPDGSHSWAPLGPQTAATVADVQAHLSAGHTSWTVVVALADRDAGRLRALGERATSVGGVVLVEDAERRVLAAIPASTLRGSRAVLDDLDKAVAWDLVAGFSSG